MNIAIPIFDRLTALDAVGPYEVLSRLPGARVRFLATEPGPQRTENRMLALHADGALADLPDPEVIVVPGGFGTRVQAQSEAIVGWLRRAHRTSRFTTSVCTGALLLGAAGILNGVRATTHWLAVDELSAYDAVPVQERVVREGKVITAAGVSAGIDMALTLAGLLAGEEAAQAIQLGIEYEPAPPFASGSPGNAPQCIVELVRRRAAVLV